jgi:hypothetical protein
MKNVLLITLLWLCKIVSAQNVGIGTLTPTSKLNVNGQVTIDQKNFGGYGGLLLKGDAPGNNYPNIAFTVKNNAATPTDEVGAMIQGDLQSNAAGAEAIDLTFLNSQSGQAGLTEKMRIKANGNVGIGTGSPGFPLNFANTIGDKISLYGNAGNHYGFGIQGGLLQMHSGVITDDIAFGYGSSSSFNESMRIKGNGNVGIGTSSPQAYGHGGNNKILEIKNSNISVNSQSHLLLSTGAADGSMGGITWAQHNVVTGQMAGFLGCVLDPVNTGSKLVFYTRNATANLLTEKMTIDGNGNVGIGLNPSYKLHIGTGTNGLRIEGPATAGTGVSSLSIGGTGDVVIDKPGQVGGRLTIKENGKVGIGEPNPTSNLTVNGTIAGKVELNVVSNATVAGAGLLIGTTALYYSIDGAGGGSGENRVYSLPAASSCTGRIIIVRNNLTTLQNLESQGGLFYDSMGNLGTTFINLGSGGTRMIQLISDGVNWIYWRL